MKNDESRFHFRNFHHWSKAHEKRENTVSLTYLPLINLMLTVVYLTSG